MLRSGGDGKMAPFHNHTDRQACQSVGLPNYQQETHMQNKQKIHAWYWHVFGHGTGTVYLYYFEDEKNTQKQRGKSIWACKVGSTQEEVLWRVEQQLKKIDPQYTFEKNERPDIPILFKSDKPKTLETQIHDILKAFNRKINTKKRQEWYITGREWFLTNPNEVMQIYLFIVDFENYAWHAE